MRRALETFIKPEIMMRRDIARINHNVIKILTLKQRI